MRDEIKHTPGPWALSHDSREGMEWNIHIVQEAAPHLTVCFMTSDGPNEANARLIAAAPEMLTWLEKVVDENGVLITRELIAIQALIDKITGAA